MTWQRIDENTYIDDTLVTCAEYQLFIDEMREQGKYYQPDHWSASRFLNGQAHEPILGIRYTDAVAFCNWLTQRSNVGWKYRLPIQGETLFPIHIVKMSPLGYWNKEEFQFTWVGSIPKNARGINFENFPNLKISIQKLDLSRALDITNSLDHSDAREVAASLYEALKRDWPLADVANNLVAPLAFAINSANNLLLAKEHKYAREYVRDLNVNLDRAREIAGDLIPSLLSFSTHDILEEIGIDLTEDIFGSLIYGLINDIRFDLDYLNGISHNVDFSISLTNAFNLACQHNHDFESDLIFDIITLQERITGRSPAFEGIRLVKERTR